MVVWLRKYKPKLCICSPFGLLSAFLASVACYCILSLVPFLTVASLVLTRLAASAVTHHVAFTATTAVRKPMYMEVYAQTVSYIRII
jgi:hypothetical protein